MDQIAGGKTKLKSPTRVHKLSNNTSPNNNNYQKYLTSGQKVQKQISDKKIKFSPRRVRKMKPKKVLGGREDFSDISRKLLAGKNESGETAPAAPASVPTDQAAPATPAPVLATPASVLATPAIAEKRPRSKNKSSKRLAKRQTKRNNQRQVRVSKSKILTQDDIKRVERKIAEIRKRKLSDMKKELEKRGVKTTGKSNRLLKDIYLYSKICNVNFQHEK